MLDERTNTEYAAITAAYGTDADKVEFWELKQGHLLIGNADFRALGLHKATVFKLAPENRKRLAWAEKYFVPQGYMKNQNIIAGSLNIEQRAIVLGCFVKRGLAFPLP